MDILDLISMSQGLVICILPLDTVQSAAEGVPVEELLANWMAPEILRGEPYSQLADVYSLGIVFWEIISGILPFEGLSQSDIRRKIASGRF